MPFDTLDAKIEQCAKVGRLHMHACAICRNVVPNDDKKHVILLGCGHIVHMLCLNRSKGRCYRKLCPSKSLTLCRMTDIHQPKKTACDGEKKKIVIRLGGQVLEIG